MRSNNMKFPMVS